MRLGPEEARGHLLLVTASDIDRELPEHKILEDHEQSLDYPSASVPS